MFSTLPNRLRLFGAALLIATFGVAATPGQALAVPAAGTGDEGGTPALRAALDEATRGFIDAQGKLEASRTRQAALTEQATKIDAQLAALHTETDPIVSLAYRTGGLRTASALLDSGSPDGLLAKATMMNALAVHNGRLLHQFGELRDQVATTRAAIDAEIVSQQQQLDTMAKRRSDSEAALRSSVSSGVPRATSSTAASAPRKADGTFASQSCSLDDPTTSSGCITPRTLNALQQAKAAGFTHFVSCFRSGGDGEHPLGRACDFAANATGFEGVASGDERTYGNNLAAYFVANASRLGVMYVIWFRQIWSPALGWHAYNLGNGDPSSDHTNHVHLSVV
jgi:hypothetical protein